MGYDASAEMHHSCIQPFPMVLPLFACALAAAAAALKDISRRAKCGLAIATLLSVTPPFASLCEGATVTDLQVVFRRGQTFVTFKEVSGDGVTYQVYRSTAPIKSLSGLTPVATLPQGSGINRYTGTTFVIADLGAPLPPGTGLLVWTTEASGSYHYAVTNSSDAALVPGQNVITAPVDEQRFAVPGAVQIKATYFQNGPNTKRITEYFAWEDYATWDHSRWPYYGNRYNVVAPPTMQDGTTYPLTLVVHGFDGNGYREPVSSEAVGTGISVIPRDNTFNTPEPYAGSNTIGTPSFWYGWRRQPDNVVVNVTERRCVRYVHLTRDDPRYQVDPTRVYVTGASLGGGGSMHIAYHHPQVFAAAAPSIGWPDPTSTRLALNFGTFYGRRVESGLLWEQWLDQTWLVENRSPLGPPIIYTFAKDDNIVPARAYPDLLTKTEQRHNAQIAQWKNGGHRPFYLSGSADVKRFRLNEAYPAIASAGNSDPVSAPEGQRNLFVDWSSSLHSLGPDTAIVDAADTFAMSFKSLSVDTNAEVTIRNAQAFKMAPGQPVTWTNKAQGDGAAIESGGGTADQDGLVTVRIQIRAAGNRLTVVRSGTAIAFDGGAATPARDGGAGDARPGPGPGTAADGASSGRDREPAVAMQNDGGEAEPATADGPKGCACALAARRSSGIPFLVPVFAGLAIRRRRRTLRQR